MERNDGANATRLHHMLQSITRQKDVAQALHTCYPFNSNLLIGSSHIRSQRGVQQGDPLRPSLFALAIRPSIIEAVRVAEPQRPGNLDFKAFFLDDGVIAGKAPAVRQFLATLEMRLREIGLDVARHKTEMAPACASVQNFSSHDFERLAWVLGASLFSGDAWTKPGICSMQSVGTTTHREPAPSCILAPDGQDPLSCRTVPPPIQAESLGRADCDIRHSLGRLVGSPLSDEDWRIASRGVLLPRPRR